MRKLPFIIFGLLLLVFGSCKNSSDRPDTYFDSLVVAQVKYLSDTNPSVKKVVRMDGRTDTTTFRPAAAVWKNELGIFRQLSLFERSTYRDAYRLEDGLKDEKSNLLIRQYVAREKIPIPQLKFYYYHDFKNLKRIDAIYQQGNALYATTRRLVLEFEDFKGTPALVAYAVEGEEKMIFSDTVRYSVQSKITY